MNVSQSEWRVIEDRLQRLSDLLYWQWKMRLAAWRTDSECLTVTAEQCEARTTAYIRSLRYILTVPYTVENRSTVVCERLGIRCIPVLGRCGSRQPRPAKKSKQKATPAPAVQNAPVLPSPGTGRGRGVWGRTGPLPTARPPHPPALPIARQVTVRGTGATRVWGSRRRIGANRGTPSSAMARQNIVCESSTEPGQFVPLGGRFID